MHQVLEMILMPFQRDRHDFALSVGHVCNPPPSNCRCTQFLLPMEIDLPGVVLIDEIAEASGVVPGVKG